MNLLDFKSFPHELSGNHWIILFPNHYGVSVLDGKLFYTSGGTYEMGLLRHSLDIEQLMSCDSVPEEVCLTYEHDFKNDVLGHLTLEEVNKLLEKVKLYPEEEK